MYISFHFKHIPLKQMIALLFLVCSFLPMLIMNFYAYTVAADQAKERVETQVRQTAQYLNSEINTGINEASRLMNYTSSYIISDFLNSKAESDRYDAAKAVGEVFSSIRQTQASSSNILDMSVIGINGHCYSERNGYFTLDRPFDEFAQFRSVLEEPRKIHVQGTAAAPQERVPKNDALTISAAAFKISTNEICGVMCVTISKHFIVSILENSRPCASGQALVADRAGTELFASSGPSVLSRDAICQIAASREESGVLQQDGALVVYASLPSTDRKVISAAPTDDIFAVVQRIQRNAFFMVLISFLLILLVNLLLSKYIARPVLQLKSLMQTAAAGNLDIKVPQIDGQVEIMELFKSFDVMLSEIKALLARAVEDQNNLTKSELKALQSQINPHFLYNTLDSALWAAENDKKDEVVDLISSLSDFYRLTLRSGMDVISFDTEVNHVACYLHIMQMRYQDILEYRLNVSPDTLNAQFPKIILQPIVENSIYHGVKNKRYRRGEKGLIEVSACRVAQRFLVITVSDTGIGMDGPTLSALWKKVQEGVPRSGHSYGLINVHMRLRLMFGSDYTLSLESQPNQGTRVTIRVPLLKGAPNEV